MAASAFSIEIMFQQDGVQKHTHKKILMKGMHKVSMRADIYLPWRTSMSSLEEFGHMSNSITRTPICSALMMGTSLQSLLS